VYSVGYTAVRRASEYLKLPEVYRLLEAAECVDPQMRAIEGILGKYSDLKDAAFYAMGVALVSYMLLMRGEEHWALAVEYASTNPVRDLKEFAASSPSIRLRREVRIRRIRRFATYYYRYLEVFDRYCRDLELLRKDLARITGARPDAKTIVFAVKMFYYALKASSIKTLLPPTIPVPVDRRVCLVSLLSGVVRPLLANDPRVEARRLLSRAPKVVQKAWNLACRGGGVPPLKLDALLWLVGGNYEHGEPAKSLDRVVRLLSKAMNRPLSASSYSFIEFLLGGCT